MPRAAESLATASGTASATVTATGTLTPTDTDTPIPSATSTPTDTDTLPPSASSTPSATPTGDGAGMPVLPNPGTTLQVADTGGLAVEQAGFAEERGRRSGYTLPLLHYGNPETNCPQ